METQIDPFYLTLAYYLYLPIAILLTVITASILFKNSKIFMLDIFRGRKEIAFATNHLFEIGFYLMNIGTALLILKMTGIIDTTTMVETLSARIGGFSIYLGVMLFANLYLFFRGKKKAKQAEIFENKAL